MLKIFCFFHFLWNFFGVFFYKEKFWSGLGQEMRFNNPTEMFLGGDDARRGGIEKKFIYKEPPPWFLLEL